MLDRVLHLCVSSASLRLPVMLRVWTVSRSYIKPFPVKQTDMMETGPSLCPFELLMIFIFRCLWLADWSPYLLIGQWSLILSKRLWLCISGSLFSQFTLCNIQTSYHLSHPNPLDPRMSPNNIHSPLFFPAGLWDMLLIFFCPYSSVRYQ